MTFGDHLAFKSYEGEWNNGGFHGWGVLELNSGESYRGQWVQGKRCDLGFHVYGRNGILSSYKGQWKDDEFHGIGHLT